MVDRLGVCSWSLRPTSPRDLATKLGAAGLGHVQLALRPLREGAWDAAETRAVLAGAGVAIISGMMEPAGEDYATLATIARTGGFRDPARWSEHLAIAKADAALAAELELPLVTFHAGFLPGEAHDPERDAMLGRLGEVVDLFAARGVRVAFETGQDRPATLLEALDRLGRPDVGVNFDPANLLLYGSGDPIEGLACLAPRVAQVHVKDARRAAVPGTWGEEVPAGDGEVDWRRFFDVVRREALEVDFLIEREGGDDRVRDARRAADLVRSLRPSVRSRAAEPADQDEW